MMSEERLVRVLCARNAKGRYMVSLANRQLSLSDAEMSAATVPQPSRERTEELRDKIIGLLPAEVLTEVLDLVNPLCAMAAQTPEKARTNPDDSSKKYTAAEVRAVVGEVFVTELQEMDEKLKPMIWEWAMRPLLEKISARFPVAQAPANPPPKTAYQAQTVTVSEDAADAEAHRKAMAEPGEGDWDALKAQMEERREQVSPMPPHLPPVPTGWHYWEGGGGKYYLVCSPNHPSEQFHRWHLVAIDFIKPRYPHTNESNGAIWYTARPDKKSITWDEASALIDSWYGTSERGEE